MPTAITPPILAPVPGGGVPVSTGAAPRVQSWDEVSYTCRPSDTYRSISARFYPSEDYAAALQLYNRNHPRASDTMRRDGTLVPGETLYVPSVSILEERYRATIPQPSSATPHPVPASFTAPDARPSR